MASGRSPLQIKLKANTESGSSSAFSSISIKASLEADTDSEQHVFVAQARYSTLTAYQETQSRAPLEFTLAYRERFAGQGPRSGQANPVLYTRWVVVGLHVLF